MGQLSGVDSGARSERDRFYPAYSTTPNFQNLINLISKYTNALQTKFPFLHLLIIDKQFVYPRDLHPGSSVASAPPSFRQTSDGCGESLASHQLKPLRSTALVVEVTMPFSAGKTIDILSGIILSSIFAYYLPQYIYWVPDFSIWVFLLIVGINLASFLT